MQATIIRSIKTIFQKNLSIHTANESRAKKGDMKTNPTFPSNEKHPKQISLRTILVNCASPTLVGLSVILFAIQTSFAAQRVSVIAPPALSESVRSQLGTIGVVTPDAVTQYSFEKSSGKAGYASDGAATARYEMFDLAREQMGLPYVGPLIAASTIALTPIAAVIGSAKASTEMVSPEEFAKSEDELTEALAGLGLSARLRKEFLRAADCKLYYPFRVREVVPAILGGNDDQQSLANRGIETSLELWVENVRLQRVSSSHASYALFIDARTRLVRTQDRTVLYDQPLQFRSGTSSFIDWTHNKGEPMRSVAGAGCRHLAEIMVEQLFLVPVSGGSREVQSRTLAAGKMQNRPASPGVSLARNAGPRSIGIAQISSPPLDARLLVNLGRIGIVSTSSVPKLAVQRPLTKKKAAKEATDSVQEAVEGFLDIPYVNLLAYAAAVPASLGGQTVGAIKGVPVHRFDAADAAMDRFVAEMNLQDKVRSQVLHQAHDATTHPIGPSKLFIAGPSPVTVRTSASSPAFKNSSRSPVRTRVWSICCTWAATTGPDISSTSWNWPMMPRKNPDPKSRVQSRISHCR